MSGRLPVPLAGEQIASECGATLLLVMRDTGAGFAGIKGLQIP